ncbi:unnamed protein product [Urochloa humidicola]
MAGGSPNLVVCSHLAIFLLRTLSWAPPPHAASLWAKDGGVEQCTACKVFDRMLKRSLGGIIASLILPQDHLSISVMLLEAKLKAINSVLHKWRTAALRALQF